ncbi:hypothetical protein CIHG_09802 [Coccidioides immitis H538.4]|uniref:Uncharacterized protein n=1 Tax=Coccidioides immitis H538.4 TaxID=396776 RepID=A0A0J8S544_COCIT|nr:hypothetical protein CIHG_09802 [Coccidioides immitis H538.4]
MAFLRSFARSASVRFHHPVSCRSFATTPSRWNASQPASSGSEARKPVSLASFKRALAKVFLASFLTYQVLYLIWLQLETQEFEAEMQRELTTLEKRARGLIASKDSSSSK